MNYYLICTDKIWNIQNYEKYFGDKQNIQLIQEMDYGVLETICSHGNEYGRVPRLIFFPHWNHIIPEEIYCNYECVIFHSTDLPKGKGKEPFQWLIENGYTETMLTIFRCTDSVDAGPVYNKIPFSLNGSAEECYKRCSNIIFKEIQSMIIQADKGMMFSPKVQVGDSTKCGNPTNEILLEAIDNLEELYCKIRAWDAESYPKAYFDVDEFNFEFSNAIMRHNCIETHVRIKINDT